MPDNILNGGFQRLFRGYGSNYSPTVYSDIQPRFGFAYQVQPGTVIRAGAGRYMQRLGISDTVHVGGNAPFQPASTVTHGSVDNPGGIGVNTTPLAFTSHAYTYPSPEAWGWNMTVEQEFQKVGVFTLSYVGRRGYHLEQLANINQLQPGTAPGGQSASKSTPTRCVRIRGFSTIIEAQNIGRRHLPRDAGQPEAAPDQGFALRRCLHLVQEPRLRIVERHQYSNAFNNSIYYGPSDFDTRHVLVINYVWDIPFATHASNLFVRTLLGNWQFSGTLQGQSGRPQTVSQNNDQAGVGPGSGNQFWVVSRNPIFPTSSAGGKNDNQWFEGQRPVSGRPPRSAPSLRAALRGLIYGPGFQSYSAALQKAFHVIPDHENHQLIFKAEGFNYANHPNSTTRTWDPTSGTFGRVTRKGNTYASERQFQFSLRYAF